MSGKQRAEVLFEYTPENDDELHLGVGSIIQNVTQAEEGWMEGSLNGKRGVFPDNFVKLIVEEAPPPAAALPTAVPDGGARPGGTKTFFAKVTFAYEADNEDELSLEVGKLVEVLGEVEDGWWRGRFGNHEGVFPENFVEKLSEQDSEAHRKKMAEPSKPDVPPAVEKPPAPKPGMAGGVKLPFMVPPGLPKGPSQSEPTETATDFARPSGPKIVRATVTFDYTAEAEDELSLTKGDVIEITSQEVSEGWWEGKSSGKVGVFPNNFVELLAEEASQPAHAPAPKKIPIPKNNMLPGLTPGDLKKASEANRAESAAKKKSEEPPPSRPAKPGPHPAPNKHPAPAPKVLGKPAPPAAKRQQPILPLKKPAERPEQDEPKKPTLRPVAGSRRSAEISSTKDDVDVEPAAKPSQPAKRHVPEPAKPASTEENIPPWKKELQQKRKTTIDPAAPPAKPDPVKEVPAPAPAPAPAPVVSKPPPAKVTPAKPVIPASEPKPEESKREASGVSSAEVATLRDEMAKIQRKLADMETNFVSEIEKLESEIDEEKKSRMTMQVEIDRLKRKTKE